VWLPALYYIVEHGYEKRLEARMKKKAPPAPSEPSEPSEPPEPPAPPEARPHDA